MIELNKINVYLPSIDAVLLNSSYPECSFVSFSVVHINTTIVGSEKEHEASLEFKTKRCVP